MRTVGRAISLVAGVGLCLLNSRPAQTQSTTPPDNLQSTQKGAPLTVQGDHLLLHGKPFQIISGELEYARIPRADWRQRLRMVRAMGLNTITVYVFWNLHEPRPGVYDFTGQNNVAEFLREAQQEDLFVVLRPGPYVCAEWDLGGYPSWLLKDPTMLLRSSQPAYLNAARRWMRRLGQELAPLQASRGGPILAVQVENEYGSFQVPDDGGQYMRTVRRIVLDSGFTGSLLYTADGGEQLPKGSIPGLLAAIDFGTGDAGHSIDLLERFRPGAPLFVAEYWDGWYDHWGGKHQVTDATVQEREIRSILQKGGSMNLYMVHGGTTFGWYNGANSHNDGYQPDVSSYDYDAPIDESGRPRPKYFAIRRIIAESTHREPPPVPEAAPMLAGQQVRLAVERSLWTTLPRGIPSDRPLTMEEVDQAFGYILYRTTIAAGFTADGEHPAVLSVEGLHSYARVYLDGHLAGVLDRRLGKVQLPLTAHAGQRLDLLVENSGRVNFTVQLRGERAGILGDVRLAERVLHGWTVYPLPFSTPPGPEASVTPQSRCTGPCFYRGSLDVASPEDTFLDTGGLGKGVLWVNGHLLGRFWDVGPTTSLFVPGVWLHPGANSVELIDLNGGPPLTLKTEAAPHYVEPRAERTVNTAVGKPLQ